MNRFRKRSSDFEEFASATQEWTAAQTAGRRIAQNIGKIAAESKSYELLQRMPYLDEVKKVSLEIPPDPENKPFDQDQGHVHNYRPEETVVPINIDQRLA